MDQKDDWWQGLYDEHLADILLERKDPDEVERTVEFLMETLRLRPGHAVFDQCCGIGSLSLPLAERGVNVYGVDQASSYIETARTRAAVAGLSTEFYTGDAFAFVPEVSVDAAFNWWTSFGYDPDDERNLEMLRRAHESLSPGGRFVLDTMNAPGVLRNFRPFEETVRETPRGALRLERESRLDLARGMLRKTWTFYPESGEVSRRESSVRLHMPDVLAALLERAGFADVRLFGSIAGEELSLDSPRCICVALRPE